MTLPPVPRFPSLKRFFKIYARPELGATDLRNTMMDAKSTDDVRKILAAYQAKMRVTNHS